MKDSYEEYKETQSMALMILLPLIGIVWLLSWLFGWEWKVQPTTGQRIEALEKELKELKAKQ